MKPSRQRAFHLPGFLALALCLLANPSALLADLNTGLVAWYPFDGNASDMSGNGHHGTLQNGVALGTDRHGSAGKAYDFDGVDDYISIGNYNNLLTAQGTVSLWFYYTTSTAKEAFYIGNTQTGGTCLRLEILEDNFSLIQDNRDAGGSLLYTTRTENRQVPEAGEWHFVAFATDSSGTRLYIDDSLYVQSAITTWSGQLTNVNAAYIGRWKRSINDSFFDGSIDDVRIYDRALSAAEVASLYVLESALPAGSVTLDKLSLELSDLLDGNGTVEQALPAGSVIAVKPGDPAPAGYTLFQRNEYNASLTWEEMAPVSVARYAGDGVGVLDGKIYFVGGWSPASNIAERYDPATNQWETLNPLSVARKAAASAVLNGKLYAIGGEGLSSVEIYDPQTGQWSAGPTLPSEVTQGTAITVDGKILLVGGRNSADQNINQVLEFDPNTNQWTQKAAMPTARHGMKLVYSEGMVWAIGGHDGSSHLNKVEIYDVEADSWTTGPSLTIGRNWASAWVANGRIYVAGGIVGSSYLNSIEVYDPTTNQWTAAGNLPENKHAAAAAALDDKVYIMAGATSHEVYSNKVFAATLPAPAMDLYFRDGNATAEAATEPALDGNLSITLNMLAPDALAKLDVNQTHAQTAGSVIAVPKDTAPPAGYSLYKRSDRNSSLVWEEKAPVSVARRSNDGGEVLNGKIYFVGGFDGNNATNIAERYDPATNQWETLSPMSVARNYPSCAVLDGKLYAIGGGFSSVEIFDPASGAWSTGIDLPESVTYASAITVNNKIFLIGGKNNAGQSLNQVLQFDLESNQWETKADMLTNLHSFALEFFDNKIWTIGGAVSSGATTIVQSYDPVSDSWQSEQSLTTARSKPATWVANGTINVAGSRGPELKSIEVYDPLSTQWTPMGNVPQKTGGADGIYLNGKAYILAGSTSDGVFSAKVFAADVTPPMDLYFRNANVSGTVTLDKFAGAVVSKLDGNASALPPIGAVTAIDHHDQAPADHTILERTDRNATHVWEEMASVSVARYAYDGVEALDGKVYFVGGGRHSSSAYDIAERYDPATNQWQTLTSMSAARAGVAATVLNGKLYAIGGGGLSSVETYDLVTGQWSMGPALPSEVDHGSAITVGGKILLVGGRSTTGQSIDQVLEFDPATNQWSQKTPMPTERRRLKLVLFEGKVWAIGGKIDDSNPQTEKVEIYDPSTNSWTTGPSLLSIRDWHAAWVTKGRIYVAGGTTDAQQFETSIESYDPVANQWTSAGDLPEGRINSDAAILDNRIYLIAGKHGSNDFSNKVYAADLIPHRDLYFREAVASEDNASQPAPNQAPVFSGGTATFTTAENNATATFVVTATDPDANVLTYTKSGPDAVKFTLNVATGALTFTNAPDYEANASAANNNAYVVTITVSDGEANATQNVTVNVTDDPADNPIDLTSGLVAWYPFDGNASDMSGNGNHGIVNGATLGTDRHGRAGKAYSFDGVDDYIQGSGNLLSPRYSLSVWIKSQSQSQSQGREIVQFSLPGSGAFFALEHNHPNHGTPNLRFLHRNPPGNTGGLSVTSPHSVHDGFWHHTSAVHDGNNNILYVDGLKVAEAACSSSFSSTMTNFYIGCNVTNRFYIGSIDDVRIYDRALSAAEVATLYQLESTPPVENNQTLTDQNATAPAPGDPAPTLFRPLPKTLAREEMGNSNFRLWGQVLADGGSPVTGVAFELADNMVFRNSTLHPASMLAGSPSFFGELTLEPGKRYYYRAVATNAVGTTFGSPKRLITPPSQARWWTNAPEISGGWRNSSWLGAFRPYDNGWIYHAKLGWAYAHPDGSGGLWLWFRDHHWMWTRSGTYPYLWKHDLGTWHYLLGTRNGQPVFFDYATGSVR